MDNNQKQSNKSKTDLNYDDDHDGLTFEVIEEEDTQGQKVVSRGVYLAPNLITTLSLLSGFFSILSSTSGEYYKASLAIFLSAILDGMDGRVARMFNAQSPFGEQFDSLTDMLAFGVAPAILIYSFALEDFGRIGVACAFVFTACAAFRLARFNVQIGVVDKKYFVGIASPLAALLVTSFVMVVMDHSDWMRHVFSSQTAFSITAGVWVVICGLLMVSNIKYYSFKEFDRQRVPFWVLILGMLVIVMALYDIPLGVLVIGLVYAMSGMVMAIKHRF